MSRKKYILAVINTEGDQVYSAFLTWRRCILGCFVTGGIVLLTSFFLTKGFHFLRTNYQLRTLQRENAVLENNIASWNGRIQTLESILEDLQRRNQQIRVAAALSLPEMEYGVGGPERGRIETFIATPQTGQTEWDLNKLENEVSWLQQNVVELEQAVSSRMKQIAHYPSIRPVRGGWISSLFGKRIDPFTEQTEDHPGIDISIKPESEVYAAGAGIVKAVNTIVIKNKGYGKYILIEHGFGYQTLYAHLSKIFVKEGQKVKRWDLIGLTGNTGKSTAPHLHYGVFAKNEPKDPMNFILE